MASIKETLYQKYEAAHRARVAKYGNEIYGMFAESIDLAALAAEGVEMKAGVFKLEKYPELNRKVNSILNQLSGRLEAHIYTSMASEWLEADKKNDSIFKQLLSPKKEPRTGIMFARNEDALQQFLKRKSDGLDLSQRVHKYVGKYKDELEAGLGDGIAWGKGAKEMGRDLRQHLKEPDQLFRRIKKKHTVQIKDENGKVIRTEERVKFKLSKPALDYKPGQGVYRSSAKNIERLTRTETNMSYRRADVERYKASPFIIGFLVQLSAAHPRYDICDNLAGHYPKTFVFVGWHPQCLCFSVPDLLTPDQFDKMETDLLNGKDISKIKYTDKPEPEALQLAEWYKKNEDRVNGWKSKPYFIRDNPGFFN